ncbi:MAG: hypothetical protein AAGE59_03955 [Cyanobacteria bacterium P01_F01_bin.86]
MRLFYPTEAIAKPRYWLGAHSQAPLTSASVRYQGISFRGNEMVVRFQEELGRSTRTTNNREFNLLLDQ